ncbi:Chaperone dnaK2 [Paramuricea clavata]|uniref:Chaperone dnaK2 n=1 Tax=Paramuricea clavata TaxID=317549 RepID=A0A6S7FHJ3_PARCT|nr:Chaperone dnaK2 [Paramuricea clavata]
MNNIIWSNMDDDIINLNIGGHKMTTKRSTLCQVEGSLLASMFSGRWEDSLERDQDDAVFLDFNPQHFGFILNYLRVKRIATPENPAPSPKVPEDQLKEFRILVEYFGLNDEMFPTEILPNEIFSLHSKGLTLEEGGKVAIHGPTHGPKYALGENAYQKGIIRLKLKLESFQNRYWMLVGIVLGELGVVVRQSGTSYDWPGSYGWAIGNNGNEGVWKEGSFTKDNTLTKLIKTGDTVELVLNCDAAKLSLHIPTGQKFHIDIPTFRQTWRLHVYLYGANDKIRITNVNE